MNTLRKSIENTTCDVIDSEADDRIGSDDEILISAKTIDHNKIPLKQLSIVLQKIDFNAKSDSDDSTRPRRGTRLRKKPKTYQESEHMESPVCKQTSQRGICMGCEIQTDTSEDEFEHNMNSSKKATALFTSEDVEGQEMFGFKAASTHSKAHMAKKARESLPVQDSPSGMKRPHKFVQKRQPLVENTPKHVNALIKNRINKQVESDHGESDSSSNSSDEYCPDEDNSSTDSQREDNQNSSASAKELSEEDSKQAEQVSSCNAKCAEGGRVASPNEHDDYFIHPEQYFLMHSNKKNITSDHTLERLTNLHLMDEKMTKVDESDEISEAHQQCIRQLSQIYKSMFDKWLYVLREDFNVLLYGVGSKRNILESFRNEKLRDNLCVVVNGFFPSLTVGCIVECILSDLLEVRSVPSNPMQAIAMIDQQLSYHDVELFVLVHNLDGAMLRNNKAQKFLSQLAKIKRIHMLASVDHINAALICDHSKLSSYKFTWWDATSLLPYTTETSYETSLTVQGSGALALSSLRSVYRSLTSNAKGIYLILVQKQLDNIKTSHYQGLAFKDLYSLSREAFLVSSDIALRAQLTEFLDHKLVKMKRSVDGIENLLVPIDNVLLQQFLDHQQSQ